MASPQLLVGRRSEIGHYYSITTVARGRLPLLTGRNAEIVVEALSAMEVSGRVENIAWAVMPDHMHWLFVLHEGSLADVVGRCKSCSARSINALGEHSQPVWQAGYYDHRLRDEEDLASQAVYIYYNPVRRGLVAVPSDYRFAWCRYGDPG